MSPRTSTTRATALFSAAWWILFFGLAACGAGVRGAALGNGSLALCITGGLRGGNECVESIRKTFVRANSHLGKVDVFLATWSDRQCVNSYGMKRRKSVTEKFIRNLYRTMNVASVYVGNATDHPIPKWAYESNGYKTGVFPMSYKLGMLDGTHHMTTLWEECLKRVSPDYDVVVRIRFDQCFPPGYTMQFIPPDMRGQDAGLWKFQVATGNQKWATTLQPATVYMSENTFHRDRGNKIGTIPDDRMGFGLTGPMKGVYGTLRGAADAHAYDVDDETYSKRWGDPKNETGTDLLDNPRRLVNPKGAWVRERYPEKLLKHHIIQSGYKYEYIGGDWKLSPYLAVPLVRECKDSQPGPDRQH